MERVTLVGTYRNQGTGQTEQVWLHRINSVDELPPYIDSLVECYKRVFAGHPYYENYEGQEETFIIPAFRQFIQDGILVLLVTGVHIQNGHVVGFGAGIAADRSEVADFLNEHRDKLTAHPNSYIYMAELGVVPEFEKQGLGTHLVQARIAASVQPLNGRPSFSHLIMRTAKEASNSRSIYERLGAREVPGLVQQKEGFNTKSTERVFLVKNLKESS